MQTVTDPHATRRPHTSLPNRRGRRLSHLFIVSLATIVGYSLAAGPYASPPRLASITYAMPVEKSALVTEPAAADQASSPVWLNPDPTILRDDTGEDENGRRAGDDSANGEADAPRSGLSSRGGVRPEAPSEEAPAASITSNQRIADTAMAYLGAPYAWSGNSPRGFDCSGFVQYVYRLNGLSLPRDIAGMIGLGQAVARDSLQPGDVVVFVNTFERGLSHVGICLGEDRFIHSISERRGVGIDTLDGGFWGAHYYTAIRF